MTIKERLNWLIDIEQCSDNLAIQDARRMVAHHSRIIKEMYQEELDEKIRLIEDMKYIAGIVERGTGEPLRDNVAIKRQLLAYVKSLEKENKELQAKLNERTEELIQVNNMIWKGK